MERRRILQRRVAQLRKQIKEAENELRFGLNIVEERAKKKELLSAAGEHVAAAQELVSDVLSFSPDDKFEQALMFLYEASKIILDSIPRGPA